MTVVEISEVVVAVVVAVAAVLVVVVVVAVAVAASGVVEGRSGFLLVPDFLENLIDKLETSKMHKK